MVTLRLKMFFYLLWKLFLHTYKISVQVLSTSPSFPLGLGIPGAVVHVDGTILKYENIISKYML